MKLLEFLSAIPTMSVEDLANEIVEHKDDIEAMVYNLSELRRAYPDLADIRVKDLASLQKTLEEIYEIL